MHALLVVLFLLVDAPAASIIAPPSAAPGDLVILDATASVGDVFLWESIDGASCLPVDGGRRLVFACGRPGTYHFLLVAGGISAARASISTVTAKIEAPAPPQPPDPTPLPPAPTPEPVPTPIPAPVVATFPATTAADVLAQVRALRGLK